MPFTPSHGFGNQPIRPVSLPQKPLPKPSMPKPAQASPLQPGKGLSHPQPGGVSLAKLKRELKYNEKARRDLALKLKLQPFSAEMDKAIDQMISKVPKAYGDYIDKNEALSLSKPATEFWDKKSEVQNLSKDGFTFEELKQIDRTKTMWGYLKGKLGIKK